MHVRSAEMTAAQNVSATRLPSTAAVQLKRPCKLLLYGDFSCPGCCLDSHRIDALTVVGVDIEWRAVELHRELPDMGVPLEGSLCRG